MKIFSANKTSRWQGGSTTEIFIFPANSSYGERNFQFRISTATIEIPESTFSKLPGIRRKIMVLDGQIHLIHRGRYSKHLGKFDCDSFAGDWDTYSLGYATDFNLMVADPFDGELAAITLNPSDDFHISKQSGAFMILLYCYRGAFYTDAECVNQGWVAVFAESEIADGVKIQTKEYCEVVVAQLWRM